MTEKNERDNIGWEVKRRGGEMKIEMEAGRRGDRGEVNEKRREEGTTEARDV